MSEDLEQPLLTDKQNSEKLEPLHHTHFDHAVEFYQDLKFKGKCWAKGKNGGYPTSRDGWFKMLIVIRGRALDNIFWPWLLTVLNTLWWVCATRLESSGLYNFKVDDSIQKAYGLGIAALLGFLLTFRVNRAIARFWTAMGKWGTIVVSTRSLVSSVLIHGRDHPYERDQAVVWAAAFSVALKKELRGFELEIDDLRDLLSDSQIKALNEAGNSPLYAANEIRYNLKKIFDVTKEFGCLSPARSSEMRQNEKFLDALIHNAGGLEGLKGISTPVVFISHLRTVILIYTLSMPYLYADEWGWAAIPIVAIISFFYLGVEGAAEEVECPFDKGKVNDLDLDGYCLNIMKSIQQLVQHRYMKEE
mmetsp:Transcript_8853/g.12851  ORF Transcript_8853/g.12851 Transcript_8853/m.12851 type:complete len:361 (+) Transcript_8853:93-1175(+)|eukprot:CAMPEP_0195516992 /NCGR_PEP_ID=MMETSP0794_2-20130614/9496_1 /TAXON_ID=515487 /ORGANISM="Stephanopyxis turris, Strain CCMP 815" /LENGTH=360 /DNA_ID=CAMNT_0040645721 /DNA_START=94 /DNA_END=1176 /DNA_ORIENTATION=-